MSIDTAAFDAVITHLEQELQSIRTGRANPALVEQVKIEVYGSTMPLVQLASITTSDAKTIVVQPWDKNVLKDIERGLSKADVGITPVNDGSSLRLTVPSLTEERRKEYIKLLHSKLELARISIRKNREDFLKILKVGKQDGSISENDFFLRQKELQKSVDEYIKIIEKHGTNKESEIMTV